VTTGEETVLRSGSTTSVSLASGSMFLAHFTARKTETTTQVRMLSGSTPAASLTLAKIGLYSIAANGDGTLVASTASDTTLFNSGSTTYTRSWAVAYAKVAGQRYALAVLVVGTTAGQVVGISTGSSGAELAITPRVTGTLAAQADLPASYLAASLITSGATPYGVILP
jgi:hypothetical protein